MRIPVGTAPQHHFMTVKQCHQHHPSRLHHTLHASHVRHPLSILTIPYNVSSRAFEKIDREHFSRLEYELNSHRVIDAFPNRDYN